MIKRKLTNQESHANLHTQMDFKGISIETRLKLKIMAAARGIPPYQLLGEITEEAWQKVQNTIAKQGISGKMRKEARKLLQAQASASSLPCR